MKACQKRSYFHVLVISALVAFFSPTAHAQSSIDPTTSESFEQVVSTMQTIRWWNFGTAPGSTVTNLQQLSGLFNPYGIAGTTVTHQEWERYQTFNNSNFVFANNALNITATIPSNGGLFPGGIDSGQIWSKDTFVPGKTGYNTYAFLVRMKVPNGAGMWSQSWLYTQQPGKDDGSEIDNPEFMNMQYQDQYDWTGFDHGPSVGSNSYSLKTNAYVWHPGIDFSAAYHDYELVWTPDATYKYVDGVLIEAQSFHWTSPGTAQLGVALAVGSNDPGAVGLFPTSLSEFPSVLSLQYIGIWAK